MHGVTFGKKNPPLPSGILDPCHDEIIVCIGEESLELYANKNSR